MNIYLTGFMGTGKSHIMKILARKLQMQGIDFDDYIVETTHKTISQIFLETGEADFRKLETEVLITFSKKANCICACGGGIILNEKNCQIMKETGYVVLLEASAETIYARTQNDQNRPLLAKNIENIQIMMDKRQKYYAQVAEIVISTDDKSLNDISDEIIKKIKEI